MGLPHPSPVQLGRCSPYSESVARRRAHLLHGTRCTERQLSQSNSRQNLKQLLPRAGIPSQRLSSLKLYLPWGAETLKKAFSTPRSLHYLRWTLDQLTRGNTKYLRRILFGFPRTSTKRRSKKRSAKQLPVHLDQ